MRFPKQCISFLVGCLFFWFSLGWLVNATAQDRPKLMVGIVVDQMRYDHLFKYANRYTTGGFMRFLREGNAQHAAYYSYIPTYTAPGHATIYTGTTPSHHGIIANEWYSRSEQTMVYCVDDTLFQTVGGTSKKGRCSPNRLLCNTLGDGLKQFSQGQAKVFSLGLKDRSAILPGGHLADGAFWFEGGKSGHWITSSYYTDVLPKWVESYNKKGYAKKLAEIDWNTLYPLTTYRQSGPDNNAFEMAFKGEDAPVFPHKLKILAPVNDYTSVLKYTPYGNSLTFDFAKELLEQEHLGEDEMTDLLAISLSSTDYIGHRFGTHSVEIEDTYLRLDEEVNKFLQFLDEKYGRENYLVFLTSDHGAMDTPGLAEQTKNPAGFFNSDSLWVQLKDFCLKTFNTSQILDNLSNNQLFLNADVIDSLDLADDDIESIVEFIESAPGVDKVVLSGEVELFDGDDMYAKLKKGYHNKLSGDILFTLLPNWVEYEKQGTTHGSGFEYDTHVPLLFMGWGIKAVSQYDKVSIEDITPTLCALLKITFPSAATGKPIPGVFR
ncbi:MAG TPA: alkaline phosphatase PafA [Luteibaculaceae bacterium]|nr:alkaline phosphatase PafA [Luteibaculaceae bacterium]